MKVASKHFKKNHLMGLIFMSMKNSKGKKSKRKWMTHKSMHKVHPYLVIKIKLLKL